MDKGAGTPWSGIMDKTAAGRESISVDKAAGQPRRHHSGQGHVTTVGAPPWTNLQYNGGVTPLLYGGATVLETKFNCWSCASAGGNFGINEQDAAILMILKAVKYIDITLESK